MRIIILGALLGTCLALTPVVAADKSSYTLFNPVPNNLLREFEPDRPTKSIEPFTVDAGHFQYESSVIDWIYDHHNGAQETQSDTSLFNTIVKLGITNRTDIELVLSPLNFNYDKDRGTGTSQTDHGLDNIETRVKVNLLGNDSGHYAVALLPYVRVPTGSQVSSRHIEGGLAVPFAAKLSDDWTLNIVSEVDIQRDDGSSGTHADYQNLIDVGYEFAKDVTAYAELWSNVRTHDTPQYTADFALAWNVSDNLQLDTGVNLGLNRAADDVQSYVGVSERF